MRIDDIQITEFELTALEGGASMVKTTDKGERIWLHASGVTTGQPNGSWSVPVGDFMAGQLRTGGRSGYAGSGYPFVLSIHLTH
jgi:hypothetical protein